MIATLRGKVQDVDINSIVIDVGGVGYELTVTSAVINMGISVGMDIFLYTYLQIREDGASLFGFATKDEKKLFEKLISVSGVGPKGAVSILSHLGADGLIVAIATNDSKGISKAQGIGSKTAQKIILELKDKVDLQEVYSGDKGISSPVVMTSSIQDAVMALVALGFKEADAMAAVKKIPDVDSYDAESILNLALKKLF